MGDRWLGPRHAIRVKKNPLHYTTKIESCKVCIRCDRPLHKSAFVTAGGVETGICAECREELLRKADRRGGLP